MENEKIIQIIKGHRRGHIVETILGLSSDGTVYAVNSDGLWEVEVPPLSAKFEKKNV